MVESEVISTFSPPSSGALEIFKFLAICRYIVKNKVIFKSDSYSAYVLCYSPLSVGESGGFLYLVVNIHHYSPPFW